MNNICDKLFSNRKEYLMRFLVVFFGISFLVLGFIALIMRDAMGPGFIVAGAILFSIGAATCDIINAIKQKHENQKTDQKP